MNNNDNNKYEYEKQLIKDTIEEVQKENLINLLKTEEQFEKNEQQLKIKILLIQLWPLLLLIISLIIGGLIASFK